MRLVVVMKAEERAELPTADELRRAGFAVSGAVGPARTEVPCPGSSPKQSRTPHAGRADPGGERCGEESGA